MELKKPLTELSTEELLLLLKEDGAPKKKNKFETFIEDYNLLPGSRWVHVQVLLDFFNKNSKLKKISRSSFIRQFKKYSKAKIIDTIYYFKVNPAFLEKLLELNLVRDFRGTIRYQKKEKFRVEKEWEPWS